LSSTGNPFLETGFRFDLIASSVSLAGEILFTMAGNGTVINPRSLTKVRVK
jgi:hypothetical protein